SVLLLFVLAGPLAAEEATSIITPMVYPGLAEIIPRASTVTEEGERAAAKMAAAAETSTFQEQLRAASERQDQLFQRITALGPLEGWNVDRLLEFRGLDIEERGVVKKILDGISARISELDGVRREFSQRWDFWT